MAPGSPRLAPKPQRPRAYVIRLPGVFVGANGHKEKGSFQTIVMALNADHAWDVAIQHDAWTTLPFEVKDVQIFPMNPLVTNGSDQTH